MRDIKPIKSSVWNIIPKDKQDKTYYLAGLIVYDIEELWREEILNDKKEFELAVEETCLTLLGDEGYNYIKPVKKLLLNKYKGANFNE